MANIIFLTYEMIPFSNNWGGCQRIHYMANHFSKNHNVTVIASQNTSEPSSKYNKKQNYETIFLPNIFHSRIYGNGNNQGSSLNSNENKFKRITKLLSKKLSIYINTFLYNEPTNTIGPIASFWSRHNCKRITKLAIEKKADIIIISIPPWSILSHHLIKSLNATGAKLIIDYRDPWNCWNDKKGLTFRKENIILSNIDGIFVTNENHRQRLIKDFSISKEKIKIVMNGYDNILWQEADKSRVIKNRDKFVISYIGTIGFHSDTNSSFRDPTQLMNAISKFPDQNNIEFRIIGCYDETFFRKWKSHIPNFKMIPRVSQLESLIAMRESDVLINLHTANDSSSRYLIAGKIFDYFRSGAKILSITPEYSVERQFILNNRCGVGANNNTKQILESIKFLYGSKKDSDSVTDYSNYTRDYQNEIALNYVNKLLESSTLAARVK